MTELKLSEIWIYPIKSLGGIRLPFSRVMAKGLEYDRRWMLIDEKSNFITQRTHSKLALFKVVLKGDFFTINFKNDNIDLPVNSRVAENSIEVVIWDDIVEAHEVLGGYSDWFSQRLGFPCRLVFFSEENPRLVEEKYRLGSEQVSLADGYPYMIIGQSSLDDLNSKLKDPVPMNRFRPNLVFSGGKPFEEDDWRNFTIGKNRFKAVKPCGRCVLTTVNQETAENGIEPLATLSTYRKENNKINFGQNLFALDYYEIQEGDEIQLDL